MIFLSLFVTFPHLRNLKKSDQRRVTIPRGQQYVSSATSLSKAVWKTAELPALCNVVSSIYQLSVLHFAMSVSMCIYLQYRINKQCNSPQFSVITVDRLKHLITAWIIKKFIQLVNFVTFNVFFLGNRVWLNQYEGHPREMSYLYS